MANRTAATSDNATYNKDCPKLGLPGIYLCPVWKAFSSLSSNTSSNSLVLPQKSNGISNRRADADTDDKNKTRQSHVMTVLEEANKYE